MFDIEREIASQPEVWKRAADLASNGDLPLPGRSDRVVALGCGTSWFVAQAYPARRAELGAEPTDAFTPTELPRGPGAGGGPAAPRGGAGDDRVLSRDGVPARTREPRRSAVARVDPGDTGRDDRRRRRGDRRDRPGGRPRSDGRADPDPTDG